MKLDICTRFQVNQMNCVESRGGGGPIDPPSRLRVTIFSSRLPGLMQILSIIETTVRKYPNATSPIVRWDVLNSC